MGGLSPYHNNTRSYCKRLGQPYSDSTSCHDEGPPDLYVEVGNEGWGYLCCLCRSWCGLGVQHGLWQCCGGHHKAKAISSPQAQPHVATGLSEVRKVGLHQHSKMHDSIGTAGPGGGWRGAAVARMPCASSWA